MLKAPWGRPARFQASTAVSGRFPPAGVAACCPAGGVAACPPRTATPGWRGPPTSSLAPTPVRAACTWLAVVVKPSVFAVAASVAS
jgi:hypothetical protein